LSTECRSEVLLAVQRLQKARTGRKPVQGVYLPVCVHLTRMGTGQ